MAVFQEQEYNKPFDLKVWKKMLPFLRPYYVNLFIVIVLNIVMALIDISMPLFQRYTIDHYIGGGTLEGIGWFTLLYTAAIVFQTVVVIISTRQSMFIEMKTNRDMKRACFVHLQTLSFSFYNVTPIGYLIARVMSDTGRISGMLAWGLMDVMWSLVYVLGVFIGHVDAQLETGSAGYAQRSAHRDFNRLFSEQNPPLEPKNQTDQLPDYRCFQ